MNGLAGRGFGLARAWTRVATAAKKPNRAFFKTDTSVVDRFTLRSHSYGGQACCIESHGGKLRCQAGHRKPIMQDIAGACEVTELR